MEPELITTVATTSLTLGQQFYDYALSINLPDLFSTIIIGIIVTVAREVYYHFDTKEHKSSIWQTLVMMPVGIAGAIMGGEIAILTGGEQYSWLYTVAIAFVGGDALAQFSNLIIGMMQKGIAALGLKQDQQSAHELKKQEVKNEIELKQLEESLNQPI